MLILIFYLIVIDLVRFTRVQMKVLQISSSSSSIYYNALLAEAEGYANCRT